MVLYSKSHQENMTEHYCQWRMYVTYQKLNQFTRQFSLSIPQCDDVVQDIETEENYFIAVHMENGYWQVLVQEEAQ